MVSLSNLVFSEPSYVIPAPGALLLGGFGIVLVGGLRRTKRVFEG